MSKLSIDLHDCFNNGKTIELTLRNAIKEVVDKRIDELEIIHGKGSGQLKKRVDRFLQQPEIKQLYKRVKHDSKNFGRLFVYF